MLYTSDPSEWLEKQKQTFETSRVERLTTGNLSSFEKASNQGCLFHGSPGKQVLRNLQTQDTRLHHKKVVFAGFPWVALCFTARWNDSLVSMGTQDGVPYLTIYSQAVLEQFKQGGTIYQLSPKGFTHTERLTRFEFVSTENVVPISHVFVSDPLVLIKDMGVVVKIEMRTGKPPPSKPIYHNW